MTLAELGSQDAPRRLIHEKVSPLETAEKLVSVLEAKLQLQPLHYAPRRAIQSAWCGKDVGCGKPQFFFWANFPSVGVNFSLNIHPDLFEYSKITYNSRIACDLIVIDYKFPAYFPAIFFHLQTAEFSAKFPSCWSPTSCIPRTTRYLWPYTTMWRFTRLVCGSVIEATGAGDLHGFTTKICQMMMWKNLWDRFMAYFMAYFMGYSIFWQDHRFWCIVCKMWSTYLQWVNRSTLVDLHEGPNSAVDLQGLGMNR